MQLHLFIDASVVEALARLDESIGASAERASADIAARAEFVRRSLGQRCRRAREGLEACRG